MHRRQLVRHASILRAMMDADAPLDRIGDSFVRLAEHPDFLRWSVPFRDAELERHLWTRAVERGLVAPQTAQGPIPLMRHGPAQLIHGTLPGTGLLPVIVCWFEDDGRGLFIAADLDRGHDYHRLCRWRPPAPTAPRSRWRAFARPSTSPA